MNTTRPKIEGWADFLDYHRNGSLIYLVDYDPVPCFNIDIPMSEKYDFVFGFGSSEDNVRMGIAHNMDMFHVVKSNDFFSPSRDEKEIEGMVLVIKSEFRR